MELAFVYLLFVFVVLPDRIEKKFVTVLILN
jgi:hypothetical protein